MKLLTDLVNKCFKNDLSIEIKPTLSGLVNVDESKVVNGERKIVEVSRGYIKDWPYENPEEALRRMHQEVDTYLDKNHEDEHETERARAEMTELARANKRRYKDDPMKEAGHKLSDFM